MPKFESSLGSKKFASQPMREFDVPDDSEVAQNSVNPVYQAQRNKRMQIDENEINKFQESVPSEQDIDGLEKEMQAARRARQQGKEKLSEGAKRRIAMLIGMTRTTRSCEIGDNVYVFESLKSKEMSDAILAASAFDGTVQSPFEIRRQLLSRSLIEIGGIHINDFLGTPDFDSKLAFIDELDEALLNRLYDEYVILSKECRDKYAIKTDEIAREVVEDLKK